MATSSRRVLFKYIRANLQAGEAVVVVDYKMKLDGFLEHRKSRETDMWSMKFPYTASLPLPKSGKQRREQR